MGEEIRPIETVYKGYRFRSRLEARWAVFFEVAGEEWEYEPEGFELPTGRYLPDFYLPWRRCYAEIKPASTEWEAGMDKAGSLALHGHRDVLLLEGSPWPGEHRVSLIRPGGFGHYFAIGEFGADTSGDVLLFATHTEWDSPTAARDILIACGYFHLDGFKAKDGTYPRRADGKSPGRINEAFRAARGARFEFGEHGDPPAGAS